MPFSEQVKPLWDKSPLTLMQLAEHCNISESSASRYINGKTTPPADIAEKMLLLLGGTAAPAGEERDTALTLRHVQEIYEKQLEMIRADHEKEVSGLRRDKVWMLRAIIALFLFIIWESSPICTMA